MKTYFRNRVCPECRHGHDPILSACPNCGKENPEGKQFAHLLPFGAPTQIVFLVVCLFGLQILGLIASLIAMGVYGGMHPGATPEEFSEFLSGPIANFAVTGSVYVLIAGIMLLIVGLQKRFKPMLSSFAGWKPYVAGLVGFVACFLINWLYSAGASAIMEAAGLGEIGVNENETIVRSVARAVPVGSIIVLGLVGPFCEEMAYRVGMFGFLRRLGKPLAYVLSAIVFGFIHFGWNALVSGDPALIVNEFVNIPIYIGSGAALCFLYDRFGFAASYTCHVLNNVVSLLLTMFINQ